MNGMESQSVVWLWNGGRLNYDCEVKIVMVMVFVFVNVACDCDVQDVIKMFISFAWLWIGCDGCEFDDVIVKVIDFSDCEIDYIIVKGTVWLQRLIKWLWG